MAQVLSNQNDSNRGNQGHCTGMEAWPCKVWQANPGSLPQVGKVYWLAKTKPIGKNQVDEVADDAAKQNGQTAKRPRRIDSNKRNSQYSDNSHPGIKLAGSGFRNGRRC